MASWLLSPSRFLAMGEVWNTWTGLPHDPAAALQHATRRGPMGSQGKDLLLLSFLVSEKENICLGNPKIFLGSVLSRTRSYEVSKEQKVFLPLLVSERTIRDLCNR